MVREFCRSRHILASAPSARTHERNSACSTHGKISLPSYEDSLDHVGIAVEYGRTGVSSIRVEVCHEKCLWLVVSYGGAASKLGWQPDRVSNDVNLLGIGDFSLRAYLRERMIGYGAIDADQRPIRTCSDFLAPNDAHAAVDFGVTNSGLRRFGIKHPETENESNACNVVCIHAMSGSCNDIRCNKKPGTKTADRLFAKALVGTQVLRGPKVLRSQVRCFIPVIRNIACAE